MLGLSAAGTLGSSLLAKSMAPKSPGAPQAPSAPPASQAAQKPDEAARRRTTPAANAPTSLTGPSGLDMSGLALGRNSLLGL
jgi:uncharacterized membrane protein